MKTRVSLKYFVTDCTSKENIPDKENYRPISIPATLNKVYERFIYNQMYSYFDKLLQNSNVIRKAFNAQHCLITMIEKWEGQLMEVVRQMLF